MKGTPHPVKNHKAWLSLPSRQAQSHRVAIVRLKIPKLSDYASIGGDDGYGRRLMAAISIHQQTELPGGHIRRLVATYIGVHCCTSTCIPVHIKLTSAAIIYLLACICPFIVNEANATTVTIVKIVATDRQMLFTKYTDIYTDLATCAILI